MKLKIKKLSFLLALLVLPSFFALAAVQLENQYPGFDVATAGNGGNFFIYLFNLAILVASVAAVCVIIASGFTIFFSSGNMARVTEAQDRIKGALLGTILLLGSYFIITTINPSLRNFEITNIPALPVSIPNLPGWNKPAAKTVTYEELPFGSIIESILSPISTTETARYNYSLLAGKGEEQCYLYNEEGNTIDRNGDGVIDGKDMFEGLDLSICIDALLNAYKKKVMDFNGGYKVCNGNQNNYDTPIEKLKSLMVSGCSCSVCQKYTDQMSHECQKDCCGPSSGGCRCCGGARGTDPGCPRTFSGYANWSSPYITPLAALDPCTNRASLDCARQEFFYRMGTKAYKQSFVQLGYISSCIYDDLGRFIDKSTGTLNPPDLVKQQKSAFLTLEEARSRMLSFEDYFKKRLADLQAAEQESKDKTKNVLSLAEFINLKETASDQVKTQNLLVTPYYMPERYTSHFKCTGYDKNNQCIKGELETLADMEGWRFYPGEDDSGYSNDHLAVNWIIKQKRVRTLNSETGKESLVPDGDDATLYVLKDPGEKTNGEYSNAAKFGILDFTATSDKCSLDTKTEKGSMKALIPLGQLTDQTETYVNQLLSVLDKTVGIADQIYDKLKLIADSPDQCACSSGCITNCKQESCEPVEGLPCPYGSNVQTGCTNCEPASQVTCVCCDKCRVQGSSNALVTLDQDWNYTEWRYNYNYIPPQQYEFRPNGCVAPAHVMDPMQGTYWTSCPCPSSGVVRIYNRANGKSIGVLSPFSLNYYNISECKQTTTDWYQEKDYKGNSFWLNSKTEFKITNNSLTNNAEYNCSGKIDKSLLENWKWFNGQGAFTWITDTVFEIQGWNYMQDVCQTLNTPRTYNVDACRVTGSKVRIAISRTPLLTYQNGQSYKAAANICPLNKVEQYQCQVYKEKKGATFDDIKDIVLQDNPTSSTTCFDQPGLLQQLSLWQKRLWDFQYGENIEATDMNRWTLLDNLTTVRNRFASCIQGYGAPYKAGLAKEFLFTCEEGITATRLGTYVVFPSFPYPDKAGQKNCYPLNDANIGLTAEQREKCAANTERIGTTSDPGCQDFIKDYMDDYYCCIKGD